MTTTREITAGHIDVGDARLRYWERGRGETVLLVHAGVFGDWFAPVFAEPALDDVHLVRVHRSGYGDSSVPEGHRTLADHARQCAQLLRTLGVDRAYWVGHSSGGSISMQAALDVPELVAGLILLEPAPSPAGPRPSSCVSRSSVR
ncbi:MAG: alpha/beta hydrolase [Pseudonocardia sp.]|nr:alpha/beta hydrolase [Pseudonocardia sp.]